MPKTTPARPPSIDLPWSPVAWPFHVDPAAPRGVAPARMTQARWRTVYVTRDVTEP